MKRTRAAVKRPKSATAWRIWTLVAAAAAAAFAFLARRKVPAAAPATPGAPPPAPPPRATAADLRAVDTLLRREKRLGLGAYWLEAAIATALALLIVPPLVIAEHGKAAVVLVRDLRQGETIDEDDLVLLALPEFDRAFSDKRTVGGLVALHDLQGGSVVRHSDVARPQAVATVNIAAGERLDPAKNFAFKVGPYVDGAATPDMLGEQAAAFIAAGSVIPARLTGLSAPAVTLAAGDVEVPLRAFAGALAPRAGSEVIVVATPRGNATPAVFEHVRVLSADTTREPATLLVALTRPEAMRLAALPAADLTLMRQREGR